MERPTIQGGTGSRLEGLQALRFVAAALVIWMHLRFAIGPSSNSLILNGIGAIGVDVFFVISGFVISLAASKVGKNWRLFLAHRVARVAPIYYLISLVFMLILYLDGHRIGIRQTWNSFVFVPLLDRHELTTSLHPYGWTLNFEMWFYLLFGGMVAWVGGIRARVWLPAVLAVGAVICFPIYRGSWFLPQFAFHPMVLEFCAGCCLFHVRQRLSGILGGVCLGAMPLFLYCAVAVDSVCWYHLVLPDAALSYTRAMIWGGFAFCLVASVVWMDQCGKVRVPRWLVLLGDASYSIYLIQPLVAQAAFEFHTQSSVLSGGVFVAGTVLAGLAMHLLVEKKLSATAKPLAERLFRAKSMR